MDNNTLKYYRANEVGEGLPFAFINYKKLISADDIFTPSLRDFHVIFWVKKGRGRFFLDFKEFDFEPDMLILLSKDQLYYFLPFDTGETEIVSIPFKPEFLYKTPNDIKLLFHFNALKHKQGENNTLKIDSKTANKLKYICSEMDDLYQGVELYKADSFYHYLSLFLIQCEVLLEKQRVSQTPQSDDDLIIFKFNELLEANFKEEFNVGFYAGQLYITPKKLAKLTQKTYNLPPKAVINARRLLEIKRLLKGTSKSGKEIAAELNFDEPTNMFKFFKKHVGLTPGEFKNK